MANTLTAYSSYAEVRAALGVSTTEVTDAVLSQTMWVTYLNSDLESVKSDLVTVFDTLSALASPSLLESKLLSLIKLYATFSVANRLLVSLPYFGVKELTDGRASFTRADNPFEDVYNGIAANISILKYRMLAAYSTLYPSEIVPTKLNFATGLIRATGLAVNPVTGA